MKRLFISKPIISYILITFVITYFFWFLPVLVNLPKDITFGCILIGSCGPLLAGYCITLINSNSKIVISSKSIFLFVFFASAITLGLRIYFSNKGLSDINGKIPKINEVSITGYLLFALLCLILALNASNATNKGLNENYLKSFLFEKSKWKWYLFALLFLPMIALLSYTLGSLIETKTTDFIVSLKPMWLLGFFSTFFFFGGNEEFGWRGLLQKEMQKKYSPLILVALITFLWSIWHLPLNYNGFYSTGGIKDFLPRLIFTLPLTIIFTWAYNKSKYSILTVVILHCMTNNFYKAFGQSETIFDILILVFCAYCIVTDKMWKKKSFYLIYQNEDRKDASS